MISKIVLDFLRFTGAKLNTFSSSVYSAMNANPLFPDPMPSLGELNTATQEFAAAMNAAQHFDRLRAAEKEKAREKLEAVLKRLSNYVMVIAGDDRAIQLSSGFHVNGQTIGSVDLGLPLNFSVVLGKNSGEAMMSADIENARTYNFYVAEAGTENAVWSDYSSSDNFFLVTGLQPLKTYRFRMKGVGNKAQTVETVEITKAVV